MADYFFEAGVVVKEGEGNWLYQSFENRRDIEAARS